MKSSSSITYFIIFYSYNIRIIRMIIAPYNCIYCFIT
nr:CPPV344 V-type Ig domain protein [Cooks petrelpox virus]